MILPALMSIWPIVELVPISASAPTPCFSKTPWPPLMLPVNQPSRFSSWMTTSRAFGDTSMREPVPGPASQRLVAISE